MVVLGRVREIDRVRGLTPDGCEVTSDSTPEDVTEIAPCPPGGGQLVLQLGRVTEVDLVRAVAIESGAMLVALGRVIEVDRVRRVNPQSCPEGDCGPTVIILDNIGYKDVPAWVWNLPDATGFKDEAMTWALNPTDRIGFIDALTLTGTPVFSDRVGFKDSARFDITDWVVARGATPDTDPFGDGWVDSLLANQGVNHGNESPLPIDGALLAATQNDAFMEFDLSRFVGLTAPAGSVLTLRIHAVQGLAVVQTFSAAFSKKLTRPFVESTLTYSNRPADGTDIITKTDSVLVGVVPSSYTMTLTAAEYGPYLGFWMMVRFFSTALLATPINISSREDATVSFRPTLSFSASRL